MTDGILRLVERVCADGGIGPEEISAAGIGSIGPIDREAGTVVDPANVSDERARIELVRPLRELLATDSIVLHNDAVCGVVAERRFSDAATENMVYLTISTGIGAGVVVDGDVILGGGGNAAEVGHVTIDPAGRMVCGCGSAGHWEAYCGGANIPAYAAYLRREEAVDTELPVTASDFTAADVFDDVGEDDLADLVVDRVGRWNTIGVANVIQAFAPTHIAVGGAVARNNPDAILDPVRESVPDRVMIDVPEIGVSELGEGVVLKGALLIARR